MSLAGPDGGRIVTVPADADSLADGSVLTSGEPQAVQAWTGNNRLWVLDAASGSVASPVRAIDVEDGTTTTFEVLARQVVAERTGTFLYVVTGRELADARRMLEAAGLTVVDDGVPAGDDTSDTAEVTAQEPPAGSRVPAGACVGMRTRDR